MFKGFSTPNYVQVPHEFFDIIMEDGIENKKQKQGITKSEIKLLAFMIRYTFGWQKSGFSLQFTFTDIQEYTNMGRQQVNDAISKCIEKGFIVREEVDGSIYYRINMVDEEEQLPITTTFDWKRRARKEKEKKTQTGSSLKIKPMQFENQTDSSLKIKPMQFENQTDSSLKIKPMQDGSELDTSDESISRKKVLKKESKKSIKENLSNLPNEKLRNWIEKQLQNDRLTDRKAKIVIDLYEEIALIHNISDIQFLSVCSNVLDYNPRNFKVYLKTSLHTALSNQNQQVEVNQQTTEYEGQHPAHVIISPVLEKYADLPSTFKWQKVTEAIQKELNVSWDEAANIVEELNVF
ncbi:replication protein [Brevibacillus borstelensis]|uniref:replication protein n=1 Tax=Brevibacillus borstelensis TaxID=45462 RepID=UPI00203C2585|nr:replication protein [Brevibacillus borstelensis]MCM3593634.1 replication protein [Brevibacillus borstelensis]